MPDEKQHRLWVICERHRARACEQIAAVRKRHTNDAGEYVETPKTRALVAYITAAVEESCALIFPEEEEWLASAKAGPRHEGENNHE